MKIGIMADLHGNHNALREVLNEASQMDINELLILGDIFGYYYDVAPILEDLSNWNCLKIRGNHEWIVKRMMKDPEYCRSVDTKYGLGHSISIDRLDVESIETLVNLPDRQNLEYDGCKIHLCHANPWDEFSYLYPDSPSIEVDRPIDIEADFIFFGHSHYQFQHWRKDGVCLVNVGSVGQNRKKGGIANWALLDTVSTDLTLLGTKYDVEPVIQKVKGIEPDNSYLINVLQR